MQAMRHAHAKWPHLSKREKATSLRIVSEMMPFVRTCSGKWGTWTRMMDEDVGHHVRG